MAKFTLPDLDYDYNALEPVISAEIMEVHHGKHHKTYVAKLNEALEKYAEAEAKGDLSAMIALDAQVQFHGGGHINHSLFWKNLAPESKGGGAPPTGEFMQLLERDFGSFEAFKEMFTEMTVPIQGSGWGWLGYCKKTKRCCLRTTLNQDLLIKIGLTPLFTVDVWEHAYYLQYKNLRPDFVKNIWKIINWKEVENRYMQAK